MKEWGVETYSDPSYMFSGGRDHPHPLRIYAPDWCIVVAVSPLATAVTITMHR